MNKNILSLLFLTIIPIVMISAMDQEVAKNALYLHEQKKTVRSNDEHLKQFTAIGDVILDFYADWCNPCKRMSPLIDYVAQKLPQFTFIKINRDFFMDLAHEFNITSIPTLIFLRNGNEIGRYDGGPLTQEELERLIVSVYSAEYIHV